VPREPEKGADQAPKAPRRGLFDRISDACSGLLLMVVRHYPGPAGTRLRFRYYRARLASLGAGTRIDEGVHIVGAEHVHIGSNCWIAANAFLGAGPTSTRHREVIRKENSDFEGREGELYLDDDVYVGPQAYINAHGGVRVGENVAVSVGAKIFSASHYHRSPDDPPGAPRYAGGMRLTQDDPQALLLGPVVVHARAFIGAGAMLLPGVTVGPSSWVGAGTVVREEVEPETLYTA
jgi:acetyltransferase-like isoleucine patch superfamily enzyme